MQHNSDENTLNYSNMAVWNSQSSAKNYSIFETPAQNQMRQFLFLSQPSEQQLKDLMLSEQQTIEDDPFYITPAKFEQTEYDNQVSKCYAPRKDNPDKHQNQKRLRDQQFRQKPKLDLRYLGIF